MTSLDDGLFPAPAANTPAAGVGKGRPEWERIRTQQRCDACVRWLSKVLDPCRTRTPRTARWRHRTADGVEFLCSPHAQEIRDGAR